MHVKPKKQEPYELALPPKIQSLSGGRSKLSKHAASRGNVGAWLGAQKLKQRVSVRAAISIDRIQVLAAILSRVRNPWHSRNELA